MSRHKKSKKYSSSDSESLNEITFTKIKKIYKCGICNKKIKNYCKCSVNNNSHTPQSGSNIITIMTNPDNGNNTKENIIQKGDKGDKGLTGSMGLTGNSFIIFSSNQPIISGDFIGIGFSDKIFDMTSIIIPYDFFIKQIGFSIKHLLTTKCTITLYINNKPTDYILSICDGITTQKSFNSIIKIKPSDFFCFKIIFDTDQILKGICISMVIN